MTTVQIPKPLMFLLEQDKRYKVAYGGRGSGKSYGFADACIIKSLNKKIRILCARQLQTSIKDSVHKLLVDRISALELLPYFNVTQQSIRCKNGSEFIFKGIQNNVHEIKSMEGIDICWVEEAQSVSGESWDVLIPTIRKEGSEIWITFNPDKEDDATYQKFVISPPDDCVKVEINYNQNPFFPEVLRKEMEYCKRVNFKDYEHIWLGKTRVNTDAQIFKDRYIIQEFADAPLNTRFFHGADWGFAKDPTTLVRCFIKDNFLYIDQEAYGVGVELDETPQLFDSIKTSRSFPIKADCARPETISFMRRKGFNITPAKKWSGSVEDGLAVLKSFEKIIIHPRCKHAADEFRLYSYKVDKINGDILPIIEDKNNHCLIKETLIETEKGSIPIEDIKIGDRVLTRKGYKKVLWSGVSDFNRKTYFVKTDKGNILCGTSNHKILTLRGFCDIGSLRFGDKVLIKKDSKCQRVNVNETQDLIILLSCANGAELNSQAINTASQNFVVGNVQTITCGKIEKEVYDLTIEDCHEFFANGILVHNCIDSLRYALDGYIKGRGMMKINPNWKQEI